MVVSTSSRCDSPRRAKSLPTGRVAALPADVPRTAVAAAIAGPLRYNQLCRLFGAVPMPLRWIERIGVCAACPVVRAGPAQRTDMPARNMILTATHSHTAPDYTKNLYRRWGKRGTVMRSHVTL